MHVKMNDKVILLTGKDRGQTGKVIAIDHDRGRVKVERRNMIVKHQRPNPLLGRDGARIDRENWLDASNVQIYSEELGRGVRTSARFVGKDSELFGTAAEALASFGEEAPARVQKVRFCAKTGEVFDEIRTA